MELFSEGENAGFFKPDDCFSKRILFWEVILAGNHV